MRKKHFLFMLLIFAQFESIYKCAFDHKTIMANGISKTIDVSTPEEMLTALTSDNEDDIRLTSDIDCSGISSSLLTNNIRLKKGQTFDGQFHTLKNLDGFLISENNGIFKNLILKCDTDIHKGKLSLVQTNGKDGQISCVCYDGGGLLNTFNLSTSGTTGIICSYNYGSIDNCYVQSDIAISVDGASSFGGLVGLNFGSIAYCYETGSLSIFGSGCVSFGRIAAENSGNLTSCFSSGDVKSSTSLQSKIGWIIPSSEPLISKCFYSPGDIELNKATILDWRYVSKVKSVEEITNKLDLNNSALCTYGVYNTGTKLYNFKYLPYKFGPINQTVYKSPVNVQLNGFVGKLNGKDFLDATISEIGKYRLEIDIDYAAKKVICFTIKETIEGIENGGVYELSAKATFSSCRCTIDNESYQSDTIYTKIGNHTLNVTGENGYSNSYYFTIVPIVNGVENGKNYVGSVSFNVFREDGEGFWLDGISYKAHSKGSGDIYEPISKPGVHTLTLKGQNDYELNITFSIEMSAIAGSKELSKESNIYYDEVKFALSWPIGVIDDEYIYESGQKFDVIGNHCLKIYGMDGLVCSYPFTIKPTVKGVENGKNYDFNKTISISKGSCTLDGKTFLTGEDYYVSEPGEHTIVIKGANGYEEIIVFTINLTQKLVKNGDSYSYDFTYSGGRCYLDGERFEGGCINDIGYHDLMVVGSGGSIYYKFNNLYVKGNIGLIPSGTYKVPPVIPTLNAKAYLDGKAINTRDSEVRVVENGAHVLRVVGTNFDKTFDFDYSNPAYAKSAIYTCGMFVCFAILMISSILRNRKGA